MKIKVFRITHQKHINAAFTGEGAKKYGGRWNSIGTAIIYTSESLSLATLEILVHLEDTETLFQGFIVIPVEFSISLVEPLATASLTRGWDSPVIDGNTQTIGDQWVSKGNTCVLKVPSAVTCGESNYLLNPIHPDFRHIKIGNPFRFQPDPRLEKNNGKGNH